VKRLAEANDVGAVVLYQLYHVPVVNYVNYILKELHWLHIDARIKFKITTPAFKYKIQIQIQ